MKPVLIRAAHIDDLPTLLAFEQGIIQYERPFDETLKPDPISYYDIEAMISAADAEVIVAEIDNEVVASAYVQIKKALPYLDHKHYAYLGFMFVIPEHRGRGINSLIIAKLNEWALSKNLREVRLTVYAENDSALRAYEKAGFKKHITEMRIGL